MILGLKRGVVELADHDPEWETVAAQTIGQLWSIFGDVAKDIQHVGSTAIRHVKAKPIIDIAIGVVSFDALSEVLLQFESSGIYKSAQHAVPNDLLYVIGDFENDTRTHHIHIVLFDSAQWRNYINMRDYLNACPKKAFDYESLKVELTEKFHNDRIAYTDGKDAFIEECLLEARTYAEIRQKLGMTAFEPINKGWSCDKKYCVEVNSTKYLLRITPLDKSASRKDMFEMMQRVSALGVPMCQPIDFGTCEDGVFSLQSWIDGVDLEDTLPLMTETEQYVLGLKSGEILRKIHSIPAPETQEDWAVRFNRKTDINLPNKTCNISSGVIQ